MPKETARLLEAWREAERAAGAARLAAQHAQEAADAAAKAAEAARIAAEDAGVTLDAADVAAGHARDAYHEREGQVRGGEEASRSKEPPQGLGQTT